MGFGEAEAFEVEHTEGFHDGSGAGGGLELVAGEIGGEAVGAKRGEVVEGGVVVGRGGPSGGGALDDEEFGRVEGGEDGEEVLGGGVGGDAELAGGKVEPGGVEAGTVVGEGAEVVVAGGVELGGLEGGAGRKDTGEGAFDEFAWGGGLGLVADGNLAAGGEEFGKVGISGVERDARHGVVLALGQSDAEDACGIFGVVVEHLIKIPEAEKEDGVFGQAATHLEVLLHHRGELGGQGHGKEGRAARG